MVVLRIRTAANIYVSNGTNSVPVTPYSSRLTPTKTPENEQSSIVVEQRNKSIAQGNKNVELSNKLVEKTNLEPKSIKIKYSYYGTGLEEGKKYHTRSNHQKFYDGSPGSRLEEVTQVLNVIKTHRGITITVRFKGHSMTGSVEHHDLWLFYNGPQAFGKYLKANDCYNKSLYKLVTHPGCWDFLSAIICYNRGDCRKYDKLISARRKAIIKKAKKRDIDRIETSELNASKNNTQEQYCMVPEIESESESELN